MAVRVQPLLRPPLSPPERDRLVRRARLLAWGGIGWHFTEAAIAVGAGVAASSIALVGFGADSLIEAFAGFILIWRFAGRRSHSDAAERRAQQLIAGSFFVLAAYVGVEAIRTFLGAAEPEVSVQTLVCAALSLALLIGLGANAAFGWWWADPGAALVIAAVATREGVESWRGEACCDTC